MLMANARLSILTMTMLVASAARAAESSQPPPVVQIQRPQLIETIASAWYLRGDIGMTNQQVGTLSNALYSGNSITSMGLGFDSSQFFGIGLGYNFNDWLRFDVTGEYRGTANFHGSDIVGPFCNGSNGSVNGRCTDNYTASKSELLFLGNAYVDLGTWYSITPFIGVGVGMSRNTISSFRDDNPQTGTVAYGETASKWNFAWALHAGLAYQVSKNLTIEFAYRYVDLGDAQSGDLITFAGFNGIFNPMEFKHITSHDLKLGLRFNFDGLFQSSPPLYYSPPVYAPQPNYTPMPLRSND
jgi:opacity protein-like surface antigen